MRKGIIVNIVTILLKIWIYLNKELKKHLILISFLIIIFGLHLFWTGFHNIDVAWNEERISLKLNINFQERTLDNKIMSLPDVHIVGLRKIILGIYITLFGGIVFGISSSKLVKW